jgi:hypothetical protein
VALSLRGSSETGRVYAVGQCVELYVTIPSNFGGSVMAGTRRIVRDVTDRSDGDVRYLVVFLANERVTGEAAWLPSEHLFPA